MDLFSTSHIATNLRAFFVRGAAASVGTQVLRLGLNFAGTVVLARLLSPEEFGVLAMAMTLVGLLGQFRDVGLTTVTVQREQMTHEESSALFWINAAMSTLLALGCTALAWPLAWFFEEPRLPGVVAFGGLGIWFSGLGSQHQALLMRQMRFVRLGAIQLLPSVAGIAVAVGLALNGYEHWALAWQLAVPAFVTMVIAWCLCPWRPGRPARTGTIGELVSMGGGLTGFRLMTYITQNAIPLLVGKLAGVAELGHYNRAWSLFTIPSQLVTTPVSVAAIPALSRIAGEPARFRETHARIFDGVLSANAPAAAFLIVFGDVAIHGLFGEQWLPAVPLIRILAFYTVVEPLSVMCNWALIAEGKSRELMRISALNAFLFCSLAWWGVRENGALGACVAYVAGGVLLRMPIYVGYVISRTQLAAAPLLRIGARHTAGFLVLIGVLFGLRSFAPDMPALAATFVYGMLTLGLAGGMFLLLHRKRVFPDGWRLLS